MELIEPRRGQLPLKNSADKMCKLLRVIKSNWRQFQFPGEDLLNKNKHGVKKSNSLTFFFTE
jgi:hypothetical protein